MAFLAAFLGSSLWHTVRNEIKKSRSISILKTLGNIGKGRKNVPVDCVNITWHKLAFLFHLLLLGNF